MSDISDLCSGYCVAERRRETWHLSYAVSLGPEYAMHTKVYSSFLTLSPARLTWPHYFFTLHCLDAIVYNSSPCLSTAAGFFFCWLNKVKHVPKAPRPSRVLNPIPSALGCRRLLTFQHLLFCSSSLFTPNLVHLVRSCLVIILPLDHYPLSD